MALVVEIEAQNMDFPCSGQGPGAVLDEPKNRLVGSNATRAHGIAASNPWACNSSKFALLSIPKHTKRQMAKPPEIKGMSHHVLHLNTVLTWKPHTSPQKQDNVANRGVEGEAGGSHEGAGDGRASEGPVT